MQNFADPQTLNRFSYARNNPVIYRDPTGHWFWVAVAIGALVGGTSAAIQGGDLGDILKGMAIGGVSGAVGYGVGIWAGGIASSAGASATVSAVVAGSAGGMAAGATSAALTGGNIGQGMLIGAVAGGIGGYIGTINFHSVYLEGLAQIGTGALVGGVASELTGGKFAEGFRLGVISGAVAYTTNRFLEGKLFGPKIREQQAKLFKRLEELGVDVSDLIKWTKENPTKIYPKLKAGQELFNGIVSDIYQSFNSEIDYIRTTGSGLKDWKHLTFENFHVRLEGGSTTIHYDPFDRVTNPTPHIIRDWWIGY